MAQHLKAFREEPTGLNSIEGRGEATDRFSREMLRPLRTVKPRPLNGPR